MLGFTIPDANKERWKKWYVVEFIMSIVWIGILSYVLVDMVSRLGSAIGISSVVMGLTVLAAGTSIPDALGSMVAAREGMGVRASYSVVTWCGSTCTNPPTLACLQPNTGHGCQQRHWLQRL